MHQFLGDYGNLGKLNSFTDFADHGCPISVGLHILQAMNYLRTGKDHGPLSPWLPMSIVGDKDPRDQLDKFHGFTRARQVWQTVLDYASCPLEMCPFKAKITPEMIEESKKYRLPIGLKDFPLDPPYDAAVEYLQANKGDMIYLGSEGWKAYALLGIDDPTGKVISLTFHKEIREPFFPRLTPANPNKGQITLLDREAGAALWQQQLHGQPRMSDTNNYVVIFTYPK